MKERLLKKDSGTIFNPVMYMAVLIFTVQLMVLFVGYKRMMWLSGNVTDSMTYALLGAAALNADELYRYGRTDDIEILAPREKYEVFKSILQEEQGLDGAMVPGEESIPLLKDTVRIEEFRAYSVCGNDVTVYDFDENGNFTTSIINDGVGSIVVENGEVIEESTLLARIRFTVFFLGLPVKVGKYHMVDLAR